MQLRPRSYPHPVLSYFSDDIVGCEFQSTVAVKGTRTSYAVDVTFKTSSLDLAKLIEAGKAQYAVHIECAPTRYRALFAGRAERFHFEIPGNAIDGRVELCSFILALEKMSAYTNKRFHKDYQGLSFSVRIGDTLAVAPDGFFLADKNIDPLRRIPSIFTIVQDDDDDAPAMDIDTTGHKIRVSLSKANFDAYTYLRHVQPLHTSLNSMILVPALVAVLEEIRTAARVSDGLVSIQSRHWYSTLARRLKELSIDPTKADSFTESTPALAHRLIGEPLNDGLKGLRSYEETGDEGNNG